MESIGDKAELLLDHIAATRAEIARLEATLAAELLAFEDLRDLEASHLDVANRGYAHEAIADELSLTLVTTPNYVHHQLTYTRIVRDKLPETWKAFASGHIDAYRVRVIGEAACRLSDNEFHYFWFDLELSEYSPTHTAAQVRAKAKRFVAKIEPELAQKRARVEVEKRAVWFQPTDDAMAYLTAYLPLVDAMRIHQLLETKARSLPAEGRTLDARRADAFVQQMLTTTDGQPVTAGAIIGLTIPALSLAGLTDEPGEALDGSWNLPAELVRELAAEAGTLFHRIITDPAGQILDITELGRFPTPKLRIGIAIRDGCCQFPTCSRPAIECDLDHQIPHPRGPTTGDNIGALCRRHHRLKTVGALNPYTASVRDAA